MRGAYKPEFFARPGIAKGGGPENPLRRLRMHLRWAEIGMPDARFPKSDKPLAPPDRLAVGYLYAQLLQGDVFRHGEQKAETLLLLVRG